MIGWLLTNVKKECESLTASVGDNVGKGWEKPYYHFKDPSGLLSFYIFTDLKDDIYFYEDAEGVYFIDGYVSNFPPCKSNLIVDIFDEKKSFCPGGIYTAIKIDKVDFSFKVKQSLSGIVPVYLTQSSDNSFSYFSISNNPLASHTAVLGDKAPCLSSSILHESLESSFSIDNTTPYKGTKRLERRASLLYENEELKQVESNFFNDFEIPQTLSGRTELFVDLLKEAVLPVQWFSKPTLRISGGKDSRLLLALFSKMNINATIENHNMPYHREGVVSDMIAKICGYEVERNYPVAIDPVKNFKSGHELRGGMLHSVPLHYPYANTVKRYNGAIVLGHAHHPRGGFARTMGLPSEGVSDYLEKIFSSELVKEKYRLNKKVISSFLEKTPAKHQLHYLYKAYDTLRVPNYLSVHYLEYSSVARPVYPLLDERVLSFLNQLIEEKDGFFHIVGEHLMFNAIRMLEPKLCSIPLSGKRWRFESVSENELFLGFEERNPDLIEEKVPTREQLELHESHIKKCHASHREIIEYIKSSPHVSILDEVSPDLSEYLFNGSRRLREYDEKLYSFFGALMLKNLYS